MGYSNTYKPISIFDTVEVAKSIKKLSLSPSKIDIGKLSFEFHKINPDHNDIFTFISKKLKDHKKHKPIKPKDVVLYGFGRIGRLIARELMLKNGRGSQLRLRAIVTRGIINKDILRKRASLLLNDSIHGEFSGTVEVDAKKHALLSGSRKRRRMVDDSSILGPFLIVLYDLKPSHGSQSSKP